jgi:pimeloyl-ACP methyl ester carboxylesterase
MLPRHASSRVLTPDGVAVAVQDWGAPGDAGRLPDVLLLHGFSQSHKAWALQLASPLAHQLRLVTYDLRGHGDSDKPTSAEHYQDPKCWADEVHAVITALALHKPVLVAWSYAGRIALDYLERYGDGAIGGLLMVNATSNPTAEFLGPAAALLTAMGNPDPAINQPATEAMLSSCVAHPLPPEQMQFMLDYNTQVPPLVRAHMRRPGMDYGSTLRALQVPTLVVHGDQDQINLPAMARYTASQAPKAQLKLYENVGHMAFWEQPERFNADLADFTHRCAGA